MLRPSGNATKTGCTTTKVWAFIWISAVCVSTMPSSPQMEPKFAKAFADMAALEAGAIANPDENRMVGHYWLRNADLAPTPELKQDILDTLVNIEQFASQIRTGGIYPPGQEHFTDILSIGIGGSALGPQFVAQALGPDFPPLAIHFIDNTDPEGIDRILSSLEDQLPTTLVIVTSKSGGTPETRNGMVEVRTRFEQRGLHFPKQAVAVTGRGSALETQAISERDGWLPSPCAIGWEGAPPSYLPWGYCPLPCKTSAFARFWGEPRKWTPPPASPICDATPPP
jgi:glucose-6-phosphate isomerase